jgi:hypothetical protein
MQNQQAIDVLTAAIAGVCLDEREATGTVTYTQFGQRAAGAAVEAGSRSAVNCSAALTAADALLDSHTRAAGSNRTWSRRSIWHIPRY